MILADKIIDERKKLGLSQEELAEKLEVSRQAVSKWESAQSTPDLQRIIEMSELFGVSTDYLLKDNIKEVEVRQSESAADTPVHRVSLEEANAFMIARQKGSRRVALGVLLCIISPALLIFLEGLADSHIGGLTENMAAILGMVVLFGLIAVAVYIFVRFGIEARPYEILEKEPIETAYGVAGLVKEKKKEYEQTSTTGLAIGVVLCVLSVLPLAVAGLLKVAEFWYTTLTALLLIIVALGVYLIIRVSMVKSSFDTLLQEGDYTREEKKINKKADPISGIYWCVVTAIYLGWSFFTMRWDMTWIVWPVAGVLFAAISAIVKMHIKDRED